MPSPEMNQIEELKMIVDPESIRQNMDFLLPSYKSKLEASEMNLCQLVEGLQQTLTHQNPAERALGTRFLVDVLQSLSPSKVTQEELKFLTAFFVDRLKDHHSIVPHVVIGLMALVKQKNISSEDVKSLVQALFREVHCQSQVAADRRNIYNLLKFCVFSKNEEMKEIKSEFLLGFISSMDGEKDPRNLLLLFSLVPHIATQFLSSQETFAEDLFEVIAAYFPIDFVPPVNDPYGILPEDLVLGLRASLASTDVFAPYCIPLLQEKLDSDVVSSKLDALRTLEACCERYSAASLRPHVLVLWPSLRREVVEGWHAEVEAAARSALRSLVGALEAGLESEKTAVPLSDSSKQSVKDGLTQLGLAAMSECVPHLSSPEQRMMHPSSQLLLAASSRSRLLTRMVCEKVLPLLVDLYGRKTEPVARKNTLIALSGFLEQGSRFDIYEEEHFSRLRSSCLEVLLEGSSSSDSSVKEAALSGLAAVGTALTECQMARVCRQLVKDTLRNENTQQKDSSRSSNLVTANALVRFGRSCPSVVVEDVLPSLLQYLNTGQMEEGERRAQVLETVAALCCTSSSSAPLEKALPVLWEEARRRLLEEGSETCVQYFACIGKVVEGGDAEGSVMHFLRRDWFGVLRCQLLASKAIRSDDLPLDLLVFALEEVSSICCGLMSGTRNDDDDDGAIAALVGLLLGKVTPQDVRSSLISSLGETWLTECADLSPLFRLSEEGSSRSPLTVYCLRGLISGGDHPAAAYSEDLFALLKKWSLTAEDQRLGDSAASLYASRILALPSEPRVAQLLESLEKEFPSADILGRVVEEEFPSADYLDRVVDHLSPSSVRFLGWIVKGLIMRAYSADLPWIQKLEKLLLSAKLGNSASECYAFLLEDVPPSMCVSTAGKKNPFFRMLYKQRFFERRIDDLVKQVRHAEERGRMNTLLAVSRLLPRLPQAVLKGHLQKLLPVLTQGLSCQDEPVRSGTVETLSSLLRHNVEAVTSHASTIIPSLVTMTTDTPITVRIKALECLETLAELPSLVTVPLKQRVVQGLKSSLDDRKRLVRRAAANARCAWVLV